MWIRGFTGRNGRYHAEKLDIVVHGEDRERTVGSQLMARQGGGRGTRCCMAQDRERLTSPLYRCSRSLNFSAQPVTLLSFLCHGRAFLFHSLGQKTSLHHRHWNGWLGKINFCTEIECPLAWPVTPRFPVYPQPRPRSNEHFLRTQHRHPRHGRLPSSHEAVRSRSYTLPASLSSCLQGTI
jgi:hypothetical protein